MCNLEKYDVISFDIFDTLLIRMVNDSSDVFSLVGYAQSDIIHGTAKAFAEQRIEAATTAAKKTTSGECTIQEIYECLKGYTEEEKHILLAEELKIEKAVLKANPKIKILYEKAVSLKKKIIAVSDMYLSSEFLMGILKYNGFTEIQKIYVSCECGTNKSTGGIFHCVEIENKTDKILHIGDAWRSDFLNPRKVGWSSRHIKKTRVTEGNLVETLSINMVRQYRGDYFSKIGYSVLGPILFEFCKWLHDEFDRKKITKALFFSRDGKIMKRAYDVLYPEDNSKVQYFQVSRKAINSASLWKHPDFETLKEYIEDTYSFSVRIFIQRLGLSDTSNYENETINIDKECLASEFWKDDKIREFYNNNIKKIAVKNSKEQYKLFCQYFNESVKPGSLAVIDIGWRGSMQKRLEGLQELIEDNHIASVNGYYFGIESDEDSRNGFFYKCKNQTANKTIIDAGVGLFETLFLAHEGTTTGYKSMDDKSVPVQAEYEITDNNTIESLDRLHDAAIRYVSDMKCFRVVPMETTMRSYCCKGFERLCLNPSKDDLNHFGNLIFNDTKNVPLIEANGLRYYIRRLNELKTDYHNAPWKIGFLKKNVCFYINWGKIYKVLKGRG